MKLVASLLVAMVVATSAGAQTDAGVDISPLPEVDVPPEWKRYAEHEGKLVVSVAVSGNNVTRDYVVWREIETESGQPLSVETLSADFIRLENLSIFSSIEITVKPLGEDAVTVGFELQEMPWIIPYLRVKYTEQDGFSIGPSLTSVNMLGRAMYVSGYWVFGGTDQFAVQFKWPWITANHLSLDVWAANLERDDQLNDFRENSIEVLPWVGTYLGRNGRLKGTASYFEMKADRDSVTLTDDRRDRFFRVGAAIGYDSRDSWRQTESGWWTEILLMRTGGRFLGGDGDWWLSEIDVRRWFRIVEQHVVSAGVLYSSNTGTVGRDFPSYFMYRMGGANSIRGYDIEVLGKELFGQNQFITTVEYQYTFMPLREFTFFNRWSVSAGLGVAAFVDYGDAWNNDQESDVDRGRIGYGLGLRALVPGINMVRLDMGFSESGDVFFHLGMLDKFSAQRPRLR
jgi:outer membrane protein assembly factor BamA